MAANTSKAEVLHCLLCLSLHLRGLLTDLCAYRQGSRKRTTRHERRPSPRDYLRRHKPVGLAWLHPQVLRELANVLVAPFFTMLERCWRPWQFLDD